MNDLKIGNPFTLDFFKIKNKKKKKYESLFINTKEINTSLEKEYNILHYITPKLKNENKIFDLINFLGDKKEFIKLKSIYELENRKINKQIITHQRKEKKLINFNTVNINSFEEKKINDINLRRLTTEENFIIKMKKYYDNKKKILKLKKEKKYIKSLSQENLCCKFNSENFNRNKNESTFERLFKNKYKYLLKKNKKFKTNDPINIINNLIKNYEKNYILNNHRNNNININENISDSEIKKNNKRFNSQNYSEHNSLKNIKINNNNYIINSSKAINSFSPQKHFKLNKNKNSYSCKEFIIEPNNLNIKLNNNLFSPTNYKKNMTSLNNNNKIGKKELENTNKEITQLYINLSKEENEIINESNIINNNLLEVKFDNILNIKILDTLKKINIFKRQKKNNLNKLKKNKKHQKIRENFSHYKKGLYEFPEVNEYIYGSKKPSLVFGYFKNRPLKLKFKK